MCVFFQIVVPRLWVRSLLDACHGLLGCLSGRFLAAFWEPFGASWGALGASWDPPGSLWRHLGGASRAFARTLGPS